ncbi:Trichohyalin plectin like domain [Trypanosoma vivax]|nr:Trichohyalin plectin like domain [Trypanosoma vivax]
MLHKKGMNIIEARKYREEQQRMYDRARLEHNRMRLAANFEARGEVVGERKELMRHLDLVQAKNDDVLVARRQRLAALLLREKDEHEAMLNNLAETDEQRRERLIRKARELRAEQEEDLRVDAKRRCDRLFRDKIDCLRAAESRLKAMQISDARFSQLELAERRKQEEREEEAFFAQQRAEELRLANERSKKDLEEIYQHRENTRRALAAQVEGNRIRAECARQAQKQEDDEFNRVVEEEKAQEKQKRVEDRIARAALAKEMSEFNTQLRLARRQEYERLQKEDRETLDRLLAQLEEEREEARLRLERREAARMRMIEMKAELNRRKEDTHALDKMWEEANNKEWEKREARWRADEEARNRLLRNVLIVRRQQVVDKRRQEREDAERAAKEAEEFRRQLENVVDIDAQERARRYVLLKENQKFLEKQMQWREAEKEAERTAMKTALTAQQELEQQYTERIKSEMDNLERAKPLRYKGVPLITKQRYGSF